jgi:hypothetical protein
MLCPRRAGRGHVLRPHQVGGDLHQIADPHPGIREDGGDVPPAGFGLGLDAFGHGAVGQHADLAGDVEEPGALGHFDRVALGAERRGHRVRRVADVHQSGSSRCRRMGRINVLFRERVEHEQVIG